MRLPAAAALLLLALAAPARAGPAQIVTLEVPLRAERTPASVQKTPRFNLVGLHWQGSGSVSFRTRALSGRWSAWLPAAPEDEDRPDPASTERTVPGWNAGNPYWAGASDGIQYRLHGGVRRLRAHLVWSPVDAQPPRTLAAAGAPAIVTRRDWDANELLKRGQPSYANEVRFAVVHHTAGTNAYTRAQSAAIVRGIQLYHVRGNGWNDIGYNFLVDKYGQVFEGRFGGMERNVVGAHAGGFNTGSSGVALLGNYGGTSVTPAARDALVRVLAWRLDVAHADPLSVFSWTSGGNAKFPRGRALSLRTIVGHRDTGFTDCPGARLYAALDDLARTVSRTGLPKLYEPAVSGRIGAAVRFTGRLSSPLPWTVTVSNAVGQVVAAGSGTGTAVNWTWDASAAPPGAYTYVIGAGERVRPAAGSLGRAGTLSISATQAVPSVVTPNGDGVSDSATISYTLGVAATVTATLVRPDGLPVATLFSGSRPAGANSFSFTAAGVSDGAYTIVLRATGANGSTVTAQVTVLVSRTLAAFSIGPRLFSPNRDGRLDALTAGFTLAAPADVRLRILTRDGRYVATPLLPTRLEPGSHTVLWDGSKRHGRLVDGEYRAEVSVTDATATVTQLLPFASDTRRPVLRLVSLRPLRLWVSEPAEVVLLLDGRRRAVERAAAGTFTVVAPAPRTLRGNAWDPAGNVSVPLRVRR